MMKSLIAIICCSVSFAASAQLTEPEATYSIAATTTATSAAITTATGILTTAVTTLTTAATTLATGTTTTAIVQPTVTLNALGEIDDDPQEPISLTAAEGTTVSTSLAQYHTKLKQQWDKRLARATRRK